MKANLRNLLPENLFDLKIEQAPPPATKGETSLPYDALPSGQFELFCCELVNNSLENQGGETKILRIEPIAGDGHAQYGADIFVQKCIGSEAWVELVEVKRVKRFNRAVYEEALARFAKELPRWSCNVRKFTVISSEDLSADTINAFLSHNVVGIPSDIELEIWSSRSLNKLVGNSRTAVFKYFHLAWGEMLFGVNAREDFEKFGIYEFEEPASWVNYKEPSVHDYGDHITIQNDYAKISGILPTVGHESATCLVELRNGRFSHVLLTLNHKELVGKYFQGHGTPVESGERKFLMQDFYDGSRWICDIGNCRIAVTKAEAISICNAFDYFHHTYERRILEHEQKYRTQGFRVLQDLGANVPLVEIKRGLYRILREFAAAHDVHKTKATWSIFDSSGRRDIKVLTTEKNDRFDPGFHVFITPVEPHHYFQDFTWPDDDVLLVWTPPKSIGLSQFDGKIGPRYYWDAATTYNWLVDEFIPQALFWMQSKSHQQLGRIKRLLVKKPSVESFRENFKIERYAHSYREMCVDDTSKITTIGDLLSLSNQLQSFFHCRHKGVHIPAADYRQLFEALGTVLKFSSYDSFRYIRGNLGYLRETKDMDALIEAIFEHAKDHNEDCVNSFRIDCVLRCFQVALEFGRSRLNEVEIVGVAQKLKPFVSKMTALGLLDRQSVRLGLR